jgi:hypothetical protein
MKFNGLLVVLVAGLICLPFMSCGEDLSTLRQKSQQGDAAAQYRLGAAYAFGDGVPQDYKEAVNLWLISARQGNAYAQYNLGVLYSQGQGVPQSYTEAVKYYRLAAEQGLAKAQYNLGAAYYNGKGVPQDHTEAARWFRLTKEQEPAQAQSVSPSTRTPATQSAAEPSEDPHASTVISACVIIAFGIIIIWVLFNRTKMKAKLNKPAENGKTPKELLHLPVVNQAGEVRYISMIGDAIGALVGILLLGVVLGGIIWVISWAYIPEQHQWAVSLITALFSFAWISWAIKLFDVRRKGVVVSSIHDIVITPGLINTFPAELKFFFNPFRSSLKLSEIEKLYASEQEVEKKGKDGDVDTYTVYELHIAGTSNSIKIYFGKDRTKRDEVRNAIKTVGAHAGRKIDEELDMYG